jgi:hypothetical protein
MVELGADRSADPCGRGRIGGIVLTTIFPCLSSWRITGRTRSAGSGRCSAQRADALTGSLNVAHVAVSQARGRWKESSTGPGWRPRSGKPMVEGKAHSFRPVRHIQFAIDIGQVGLDGTRAQIEALRNPVVGQACSQQTQDLRLPRAQAPG